MQHHVKILDKIPDFLFIAAKSEVEKIENSSIEISKDSISS